MFPAPDTPPREFPRRANPALDGREKVGRADAGGAATPNPAKGAKIALRRVGRVLEGQSSRRIPLQRVLFPEFDGLKAMELGGRKGNADKLRGGCEMWMDRQKRYNSPMLTTSPSFSKPIFGRAQTFPLRLGWLPKAVRAVGVNPKIFAEDAALAEFGVGKNMVAAIRYWAETAGVLQFVGQKAALTEFGEHVFGDNGLDPFLEDESTLWLLHWKMTSRPNQFAAGFWFFNRFHKPEFEEKEVGVAIAEDMSAGGGESSAEIMRRDINMLLRMYARRGGKEGHAEENLDTPFPALGLLFYDSGEKLYQCEPDSRPGLSPAVLGFAVADLLAATKSPDLPVYEPSSADNPRPDLGSVFRLTRDDLLEKLNDAANVLPGSFALREVAGAWRLFRSESAPVPADFLEACLAPQAA